MFCYKYKFLICGTTLLYSRLFNGQMISQKSVNFQSLFHAAKQTAESLKAYDNRSHCIETKIEIRFYFRFTINVNETFVGLRLLFVFLFTPSKRLTNRALKEKVGTFSIVSFYSMLHNGNKILHI